MVMLNYFAVARRAVMPLAAFVALQLGACLPMEEGDSSQEDVNPDSVGVTEQSITVSTTPTSDRGNINSGGDVYRHLIDVRYNSTCEFRTVLITMHDTTMRLRDQSLTQLDFDDDGGGGLSSRIVRTLLAGRYFVDITGFSTSYVGSWNLLVTCNVTIPSGLQPLFRLNSDPGSDHLYTTSAFERDNAISAGFTNEGLAGFVFADQAPDRVAFYRLYSGSGRDHLYTTSVPELNSLVSAGYVLESVIGYILPSPAANASPLYRLFQPSRRDHLYTTSAAERDQAIAIFGFRSEGIVGYLPNGN